MSLTEPKLDVLLEPAERGGYYRAGGRLLRALPNVVLVISVIILAAIVIGAIFAPELAPHNPNAIDLANPYTGPSSGHLFGQDSAGRDIFSRLFFGARLSLLGPTIVIAIAFVFGVPLGFIAAYTGGWLDVLVSRVFDLIFAFPSLLLAIVIVATFGTNFYTAVFAVAITYIPLMGRVVRAACLVERQKPYIEACRVAGLRRLADPRAAYGPQHRPDPGQPDDALLRVRIAGPLGAVVPRSRRPATGDRLGRDAAERQPGRVPVRQRRRLPGGRDHPARRSPQLRRRLDPGTPAGTRGITMTSAAEPPTAGAVTLELERVTTSLRIGGRLRPVVLDIDMQVRAGEIVGLVGESGSGKSMTARTIANALPSGAVARGAVRLDGEDLLAMSRRRRRAVQPSIGMIFQDPRAYIDPLWRVEDHLTEGLRVHRGVGRSEARTKAIELLDTVGIDQPERRIHQYPGEMSGGMLQRVMIAGALSVEPTVLLADEATTALDVTTQAGIVRLLARLRTTRGLAVLFITHDLALANSICDRVCVMYAGRIVEERSGHQIFDDPRHPIHDGSARVPAERRLARVAAAGHPRHSDQRDGGTRRLLVSSPMPLRAGGLPCGGAGARRGAGRRRAVRAGDRRAPRV